jgi:cytochrome P450
MSEKFDHHSPEFAANWHTELEQMRHACPVARTDAHGSFVVVTKHADAQQVLRDFKAFASARDLHGDGWSSTGGVTIPTNQGRMGFMEMDPPESLKHRRIVNPWLSRNAVRDYRPRIAEVVNWCIDRVVQSGSIDVVDDLANPIPAIVTLDVLGIDLTDWQQYADAAHGAVFREPGSGQKLKWVGQNVRDVVDRGGYEPDGLIAAWKSARIDAEPLPDEMVYELVYMVINGGIDTTTSLIANAVIQIDRNPHIRERLIGDPSLIPAAVQELLRFCVPSTGVARTVTVPAEIGGCPVAPGERVLVVLASANFDEDVFDEPERVTIDRERNLHLSFGTGGHRCVGAELATAELEVVLTELLRRLPDFAVDHVGVRPYPTMPLVNGYIAVPASFMAGSPERALTELPQLSQPRLRPVD